MFGKIFILLKVFVIQKNEHQVFSRLLRLTHFILCHRVPLEPHSEHFVLLGFNPDRFEKVFNSFINSIVEFYL